MGDGVQWRDRTGADNHRLLAIVQHTAITVRGIYTYSYVAAYYWDGKQLSVLWKHTSDKKGQGIYAQHRAHTL